MRIHSFNGRELYAMLVGSANMLADRKNEIDALNVFPVPDGDTGTNMYYTLLEGVREARRKLNDNIGLVAQAAAGGCLLGARGNSGVILSQIVAGFADVLADRERATLKDVAAAFRRGLEKATQAITNPVEGTIITVCRELVESFADTMGRSRDLVRATVLAHRRALRALHQTPEMLPVLKEAGVVDAGGQGLVVILEGFIKALRDAALAKEVELFEVAAEQQRQFVSSSTAMAFDGELEYTYCTEFILSGNQISLETLRRELGPYGDCLMVVGNDRLAKVHIHTNHPGLVMECCLKYGSLEEICIDNMERQAGRQHGAAGQPVLPVDAGPIASGPLKPLGIVAVGQGEGIEIIFKSMGADQVVRGGQTMNPSAQDLLKAIEATPAETVILLPNNKNIILAAEQARSLAVKEVLVLPSCSVVEGINALVGLNPDDDPAVNYARMQETMRAVSCGEVTLAVRDSSVNGIAVLKGQFMALASGEMVAAAPELEQVLEQLLAYLAGPETELATLYFGAGLAEAEARSIQEYLQGVFPEMEIELHYGGQPVYHFLVSVE